MIRLAANLTMLWTELDPYERFHAAADAGFKYVEMLFPHELDARRLETTLNQLDLEMVLFDPAAGDWAAGERGIACLPGREAEVNNAIRDALELAQRLGTSRINMLAGISPEGVPAHALERTAVENWRRGADLAASQGVTLLVENINSTDWPGYFIDTVEHAVATIDGVGRPNVALQLDQYHAAMAGDDPLDCVERYGNIISHVQIADIPGRHQPGTGTQPIHEFLDKLDRHGYSGFVGLEYRPLGPTTDSLTWAIDYLR